MSIHTPTMSPDVSISEDDNEGHYRRSTAPGNSPSYVSKNVRNLDIGTAKLYGFLSVVDLPSPPTLEYPTLGDYMSIPVIEELDLKNPFRQFITSVPVPKATCIHIQSCVSREITKYFKFIAEAKNSDYEYLSAYLREDEKAREYDFVTKNIEVPLNQNFNNCAFKDQNGMTYGLTDKELYYHLYYCLIKEHIIDSQLTCLHCKGINVVYPTGKIDELDIIEQYEAEDIPIIKMRDIQVDRKQIPLVPIRTNEVCIESFHSKVRNEKERIVRKKPQRKTCKCVCPSFPRFRWSCSLPKIDKLTLILLLVILIILLMLLYFIFCGCCGGILALLLGNKCNNKNVLDKQFTQEELYEIANYARVSDIEEVPGELVEKQTGLQLAKRFTIFHDRLGRLESKVDKIEKIQEQQGTILSDIQKRLSSVDFRSFTEATNKLMNTLNNNKQKESVSFNQIKDGVYNEIKQKLNEIMDAKFKSTEEMLEKIIDSKLKTISEDVKNMVDRSSDCFNVAKQTVENVEEKEITKTTTQSEQTTIMELNKKVIASIVEEILNSDKFSDAIKDKVKQINDKIMDQTIVRKEELNKSFLDAIKEVKASLKNDIDEALKTIPAKFEELKEKLLKTIVRNKNEVSQMPVVDKVTETTEKLKEVNNETIEEILRELEKIEAEITKITSSNICAEEKKEKDNSENYSNYAHQTYDDSIIKQMKAILDEHTKDLEKIIGDIDVVRAMKPNLDTLVKENIFKVKNTPNNEIINVTSQYLKDNFQNLVKGNYGTRVTDYSQSISKNILNTIYNFVTAKSDCSIAFNENSTLGNCWPVSGEKAFVDFHFSQPSLINYIYIYHPSISQYYGTYPENIKLYSINKVDNTTTVLAELYYDYKDNSVQVFFVKPADGKIKASELITDLRIEFTGNKEVLCLYDIRIYGKNEILLGGNIVNN